MQSAARVRLVQMEVLPGRPRDNMTTMLAHVDAARQAGCDLVAFPELAVPGYLIGDEWERPAFLRECEACGQALLDAARGIVVAFGNVGLDWQKRNEDGRVRKYDALFVVEDGQFLRPDGSPYDFVVKTLMPNYREFDDSRHFYDLRKLALELGRDVRDLIAPVRTRGFAVGCVLCEDAWDFDYSLSPLGILGRKGVDFLLCASCSPFTVNKNNKRNRVLAKAADAVQRPLLYVNNTGLQNNGKTVYTFDGASCIYDGRGHQVNGPAPFEEGVLDQVLPLGGGGEFGAPVLLQDDDVAMLYRAVLYGTRKFMALCGVRRVVVGASGGIDSALMSALYSRLLASDDLLLVNMPSCFNSPTTIKLARELASNLGCGYVEISIDESVRATRSQLDGLAIQRPEGRPAERLALSDTGLENVQARDRSSRVLAAVAAAFGGVFTCNANKSEMTVGYTTLYGDLGGYLASLADLWKGDVYAVARYMNAEVFGRAVIPEGCFTLVPSAELSSAQAVDEGRGDPLNYPYHDCLFRAWVEWWDRATPEDILVWYQDGSLTSRIGYGGRLRDLFPTPLAFVEDLERWWTLYQGLSVAKRIQAPPVLAIKRRAFGFDHREAQMGPRYTRRYEDLKRQLLDA
jgi:NAD+ synthase (glutamine-hydrolysing)